MSNSYLTAKLSSARLNIMIPTFITGDDKPASVNAYIWIDSMTSTAALFDFEASKFVFAYIRGCCILARPESSLAMIYAVEDADYEELSTALAESLELSDETAFSLLQIAVYLRRQMSMVYD